MKWNHKLLTFVLLITVSANGQSYRYERKLGENTDQWHRIVLPDDIFGKTRGDLADIRILGVTAGGDTIEAPYFLRTSDKKNSDSKVPFTLLNLVKGREGYFFTFELPKASAINQIDLDFRQSNFDWTLKLEGSQNQNEWFTIADQYPIMAIRNNQTDFRFSSLYFPQTSYKYYRVLVRSGEKPDLRSATVGLRLQTEAEYRTYATEKPIISQDKQRRQTTIDVDLKTEVPINLLRIEVSDKFDYRRPVTVQTFADSLHTDSGWKNRYQTIATGILSSADSNAIELPGGVAGKLRILVHNQNNPPLDVRSVKVLGYVQELIARFTEKADYYLVYGKKDAIAPEYDLVYFTNNIPTDIKPLETGEEKLIKGNKQITPLFENKAWLWAIMGFIMLILSWFSIKMIRKS